MRESPLFREVAKLGRRKLESSIASDAGGCAEGREIATEDGIYISGLHVGTGARVDGRVAGELVDVVVW